MKFLEASLLRLPFMLTKYQKFPFLKKDLKNLHFPVKWPPCPQKKKKKRLY